MFALPDTPVFVDGRTDLYGDEFLTNYLQTAIGAEGWCDTFQQYDIQEVVIEKESGLARQLRVEPGWKEVYSDDMAAIFTKTS